MSDTYKRLSDARRLVTEVDYDYRIKTETHIIRNLSSSANIASAQLLRLYTDGSSLVSGRPKKQGKHYIPPEKTFSGWGYSIIGFDKGLSEEAGKGNGFILNGTPLLGELEAIRHGLEAVDTPSCVSVICDSTDAIKMVKNEMAGAGAKLLELKKAGPKHKDDDLKRRMLTSLSKIEKLVNSGNVMAFEITWQPSHTMDNAVVTMNELKKAISEEQDYEKKMFMMDIYGNEKADEQAGQGSRDAVRTSLIDVKKKEWMLKSLGVKDLSHRFISNNMDKNQVTSRYGKKAFYALLDYKKSLTQVSMNLHRSRPAMSVAVNFIAEKTDRYLSDVSKNILFSEGDQNRINQLRSRFQESQPKEDKKSLTSLGKSVEASQNSSENCLKTNLSPKKWAEENITFIKIDNHRGNSLSPLRV